MGGNARVEIMKATFKVDGPITLIDAITAILNELPTDPSDPEHVIRVDEYKANRSAAQNRLMWMWLTDFENTDINEHAGTTKEAWHDRFKRLCLAKIYERDNEQYATTMQALRDVYRHGLHKESLNMMDHVIRETSTTAANVSQFTEYMRFIEQYAHERGIQLRTDSQLYAEAMGNKL
jgi:hypothetical protein